MAKAVMARKVFIAKLLETCRQPIKISGRLTSIIKTETSIPVFKFNSKEIPVAPPSRNPFGSKNPFNPMVAETIPAAIKNCSVYGQSAIVSNSQLCSA